MSVSRFLQKNILFSILIIFSLCLFPLAAQNSGGEPAAILVYADDEFEIEVMGADGIVVDAYIGMDLLKGDSIKTNSSTVELQLEPNGSILKLSESTSFRIDGFQRDINSSNDFSLLAGKMRTVAAKSSTSVANYNIYTQSAVCGVRGTDFIIGALGKLVVGEGSVEFIKQDTGESLLVNTGMAADAAADVFSAFMLSAEEIAQEFQSLVFTKLDPSKVPGQTPKPVIEEAEEEIEEETEVTDSPAEPAPLATPDTGDSEPDTAAADKGPGPLEKMLAPLGDFLGMEIGSFTVDGLTYSKLLFQPEFQIGKLKASLYLPVIYSDNVFTPGTWYHPAGNDEWSFGTDQNGNVGDIIMDAAQDLFLKIRYIKWGEQRDPFYFKFGNVNDMTIGHGILMMNYANDTDFPAVRKIGLNLGVNREKSTFELVADDLSNPQIFGGRLAFGKGVQFGLSGITDINPDNGLNETENADVIDSNPMLVNFGLDLDFSILKSGIFSLVLFTDAASLLPVVDGQVQTDFLYNSDLPGEPWEQFRNYGFAAGFLGNIFSGQYRLAYLYQDGLFRHGYYDSTYDRMKGEYLMDILDYLDAPPAESVVTQGIYGSLTWNFANILDITGGYRWPWTEDGFDFNQDYLHFKVALQPNVIPVIGIYGSLTYDRTNFVGSMIDGNFTFLDGSTVLKGELVVPVAPTLDVALLVTSALERDSEGYVYYDAEGKVQAYYTFTLDTRIHF